MINKIDKKYKESFDVIFMLEVSEYCWNIYQALLNVKQLLKKGGIFYLSTHFIYPVHQPIEFDSIRLTPRGVEKLLEETGFEILEMKPRLLRDVGFMYGVYSREGMRPAKNYDKHNFVGCLVKAQKK